MQDNLRLSKTDARRLEQLRAAATGPMAAAELGYRLGDAAARDALLLRAALLEQPIPPGSKRDVIRGASAQFPLSAQDLMPGLTGPALGKALNQLEQAWIDAGFGLDRAALMAILPR